MNQTRHVAPIDSPSRQFASEPKVLIGFLSLVLFSRAIIYKQLFSNNRPIVGTFLF